MNEKKKVITLLVIVVLAIVGIAGISAITSKQIDKEIEKYDKIKASKTERLVYIGRPTCSYCQQLEPVLKALTEEYNIKYEYINIDALSGATLTKVLNKFSADTSTPQLVVVKDNKVVKTQQGYTDREGLFNFFQESGLISKDEKLVAEDENLTKIDFAKYQELIASEEEQIIVVGQTGCSACATAKPILSKLAGENNITINYLNLSELSDDDVTKFTSSFKEFSSDFGTPYTIIVKDSKIVKSLQGFENEEKYKDFLRENNFID